MTDSRARELCERWQSHRDEAAITELIHGYRPLVRKMARRFYGLPSWLDTEDLEAAGLRGILDAATTYDPSQAGFMTHVHPRIRGRIHLAYDVLRAQKNHAVTVSLDALDATERTLADTLEAPTTAEGDDRWPAVRELVDGLPQRERHVIQARLDGHGPVEVAATMGLSRQRVQDIQRTALDRLRKRAGLAGLRGKAPTLPQDGGRG